MNTVRILLICPMNDKWKWSGEDTRWPVKQ